MTPRVRGLALGVALLFLACSVRADDKKTAATTATPPPSVVLVADLREADAACGCGEIIRLVRDAARRGIIVREIDPAKEPGAGQAYGIVVAPTVALLDAKGRVTRRFVGEGADSIKALREALATLKPPGASKSGT